MKKRCTFLFALILFTLLNVNHLFSQSDPIPGGCPLIGPNMVINPEFEDGNTGFTSSFTFRSGITCSYGDYTITDAVRHNPAVTTCYGAPGFSLESIWDVSDRNGPGGHFMIVDPCDAVGTDCSTTDLSGIVWEQSISVCPNSDYTFSVFVKNIYFQEAPNFPGSDTEPDFELTINGGNVTGYYIDGVISPSGTFSLPKEPQADSASWTQISGTWNSGSNTTADLIMRNLVIGSQGNDLAVDGIYFGLCGRDIGLNYEADIPQCVSNGTNQAVTFVANTNIAVSGWQYYQWTKDNVVMAEDQIDVLIGIPDYTTPADVNGEYFGEYKLVLYTDPIPTPSSCPYESQAIEIFNAEPNCPPPTFPVEFLDFHATTEGATVNLNWITASELNNKGFEVEYSQDGRTFSNLGFVAGSGTSSELQTYEFTTPVLARGTYLFRLKQLDFNGSFEYSSRVEATIEVNAAVRVSLAPNPANTSLAISLESAIDEDVSINLYSFTGEHIADIHEGHISASRLFKKEVAVEHLPEGIYLVKISGRSFQQMQKLVISH